ncbi:MAG: hypothetical protein Q4D98_05100 [Planctomycetia bacterium]|nr:hypothetical protein [Planctomycetia bacterium]
MRDDLDERELERLTAFDGTGDPGLRAAWERLGTVLSEATDAEMGRCRPMVVEKSRRSVGFRAFRWAAVATSVAAVLLAGWLGFLSFPTDSPTAVPEMEVVLEPWDELDVEMVTLHQELEEMPEETSVLDSEIALVFASLDTMDAMDSGDMF